MCFLYLIILVLVLLRVLISSDFYYLLSTIKAFFILFASIFYLACFFDLKLNNRLLNVFFINALICLVFGTFPDWKIFLKPFQYGSHELSGLNEYRNAFLSGSGYFGISAPFAFAFCYFEYVFFEGQIKNKSLYIVKLFIILLAAILAGRIAIPIAGLSILYFCFIKRKISYLFIVVFFAACVYCILQLENFEKVWNWIYDMFFGHGTITENESAGHLIQMIKFPKSDITFWFGDGIYKMDDGSYYMSTDIGYLRHLYFGGVLFMILPLLIMPLLYKNNKNMYFIVFLFPVALILHFKGAFIFNNPAFMPFIFIISHILFENKTDTFKIV